MSHERDNDGMSQDARRKQDEGAAADHQLKHATELVDALRCEDHPDHRATAEFSEESGDVIFRGTCCDAFASKLGVAEVRFRNAATG